MKPMLRLFLLLSLVTISCGLGTPTPPPATATPIPTPTPVGFQCQDSFEARELKKLYNGNAPRLTLSAEQWGQYLDLMGLESLCLPAELGAPFVNADWDSASMPATGRMTSLGFESFYHGSGWSDIFLLYSTYDFSTGTEFDRFARLEDRDAMRAHTLPNEIEVHGAAGFIRFMPSLWTFEGSPETIYKSWVFPFENHYVAVVYKMGTFEGKSDEWFRQFEQGHLPAECEAPLQLAEAFASSLSFR